MANPYPEGSPLSYIEEAVRIYDEMVADPRHPYHQPCERVRRATADDRYEWYECYTHGCGWPNEGECPAKVKTES